MRLRLSDPRKGHSIGLSLNALKPLMGEETTFVTLHNGLPFWYFFAGGNAQPGCPAAMEGKPISSVDPHGDLGRVILAERCVGGSAYIGAAKTAPGCVECSGAGRVPIGEPAGGVTLRLRTLVGLLNAAGIRAESVPVVRSELWAKLRDNLSLSPISALTLQTLGEILGREDTSHLAKTIMQEVDELAAALELPPLVPTAAERCEAMSESPHRSSMLQDLDAGLQLEIAHICEAPLEVAHAMGVDMPMAKIVSALAAARASKL